MEGVAFGLKDGLDIMVETGAGHPTQIRASGGGIRSSLWRQILADVMDTEIATVTTTEGAAYGAAVLAAVGAGWHSDVAAATDSWLTIDDVPPPGPAAGRYGEYHSRFRELYPTLRTWFAGGAPQSD